MADKPKFNKTALKAQRDALAKYEKFLPILLLKKMQLQLVLRQLEPVLEGKRRELEDIVAGIKPWAGLLSEATIDMEDFLQIDEVRIKKDNIAGVEVPEFDGVLFKEILYSLFATPAWMDKALQVLRRMVAAREELRVLQEKEALLREELRTTTQRVNLFEKKLIPELKENIRKIKIFLGDEETAAVGRAKLAKAKLVLKKKEVAYA
ncbi:MAG: V-type ATP synthase subunit D [Pseudomonadota bacterium]|uniref:V-type ATP synthase subunit D n=1 Tax=Candidatus Desulfatibia profunda TaxID=2841695 RepID=A0A8J6THI3_9BACT|nr:V-type ATP synthase subunit D [Candidatus Desulfatibia profunda]MBL7179474.1 V-type ATP synthase subunit D [Desulfobacterales bacterium]